MLFERPKKNPKEKVVNDSNSANMAVDADVLQELKSMRADLKGHITKLSDELKVFQRSTNERLLRARFPHSPIHLLCIQFFVY